MLKLEVILILLMVPTSFSVTFAYEQIPITISSTINQTHFDGKWTFPTEWKQSSLNTYEYDNGSTVTILRTAHQGDFVYVFIDAITDYNIDGGSDSAAVCFDTNNDKTEIPNEDDYCFMTKLDANIGATYRGNTNTQNFTQIPNHDEFTGTSTVSDDNDRYTNIPHPSYEFKIPTETIGRKSNYGFYFVVYDDHQKRYYTYPQNITTNTMIVTPNQWGEIYSPDKSLPEFSLPILLLIPAMGIVMYLTRHRLDNHL
jgi:hypothetical protein